MVTKTVIPDLVLGTTLLGFALRAGPKRAPLPQPMSPGRWSLAVHQSLVLSLGRWTVDTAKSVEVNSTTLAKRALVGSHIVAAKIFFGNPGYRVLKSLESIVPMGDGKELLNPTGKHPTERGLSRTYST